MRRSLAGCAALAAVVCLVACSGGDPSAGGPIDYLSVGASTEPPATEGDAGASDTGGAHGDGGVAPGADGGVREGGIDAADPNWCEWGGAPGDCMSTSACAATPGHTSYAGQCPGTPANIECCIVTPDPADNPPVPAGWKLMQQADVTTAMTTWAVDILHDPITYPMFSTTMQTFGTLLVLARVEWHVPDFQNMAVHRGVTLYEPI